MTGISLPQTIANLKNPDTQAAMSAWRRSLVQTANRRQDFELPLQGKRSQAARHQCHNKKREDDAQPPESRSLASV